MQVSGRLHRITWVLFSGVYEAVVPLHAHLLSSAAEACCSLLNLKVTHFLFSTPLSYLLHAEVLNVMLAPHLLGFQMASTRHWHVKASHLT